MWFYVHTQSVVDMIRGNILYNLVFTSRDADDDVRISLPLMTTQTHIHRDITDRIARQQERMGRDAPRFSTSKRG